jgi:hypothetical protein
MPDMKTVVFDLAHNRAHHIDRYVERRAKHRDFDVSNDQLDTWTAEAVAQWRELYPALSALWGYHEAQQREAKEATS